jgi:hypothetical protein
MKRAHKMDRKLLSSEKHEIKYLATKLRVPQKMVRLAHAKVGRSRMKVTAFIVGYYNGVLDHSAT